MMNNVLLGLLCLGLFGQCWANNFDAVGSEPFWGLTLTQTAATHYRARLSLPALYATPRDIQAQLTQHRHKDYVAYLGTGDDGKALSVMTIAKPCITEGKGDMLSHVVKVTWGDWTLDGCGGKVITDGDKQQTLPSSDTARRIAQKFNTQGYRAYKKGDYHQALLLFYRATQADANHMLGQYNLACTASLVLAHFDCAQDESLLAIANPDTIFAALKQSIRLDPKRKAKSQTDPDLVLARKSYRYYRDILGYSPQNDQQLRDMLTHIEWTQAAGFYPHQGMPARLHFSQDAFSVTATNNKGQKKSGIYRLNNGVITLTFISEQDGEQQITGRLIDNDGIFDGLLHFDGAASAHILSFDDYTFHFPMPCETD